MDEFLVNEKVLSVEEKKCIDLQDARLVSEYKASNLEKNARKYWDLFYKRNETRFFRDRRWTTREFEELLSDDSSERKVLLEVGCGVGNLIFPLLEEGFNFNVIACDLSPRAVEFIKSHERYDETRLKVFQTDVTTDHIHSEVQGESVDVATVIFVLSAIHPDKFVAVLLNIYKVLKPGGIVLFRDYGLYDMAQLRFKAGHKISENFYMRQDGTRSFYFSISHLDSIFDQAGFRKISTVYVHRRTVNKKENVDVPRIFIQAKFKKPERNENIKN